MSGEIAHTGRVERIEGTRLTIRTIGQTGCDGCKIAGMCDKSGENDELLTVNVDSAEGIGPGDTVKITATDPTAWRAVTLGLIVPVALLIAGVAITITAGGSEALAALVGLGVLVPYFAVIYFSRSLISGRLIWNVEKI